MTIQALADQPLNRRDQPVTSTAHFVQYEAESFDIGKGVRYGRPRNTQTPSQRLAGMNLAISEEPQNIERMRSQNKILSAVRSPLYRKPGDKQDTFRTLRHFHGKDGKKYLFTGIYANI